MIQNYLRIAWRNLTRHWTYVGINVFGLGMGLACCIIAYLNFSFDRGFDAFHPMADQIYRISSYRASNGELYGFTPLALAARARAGIPGVEEAVAVFTQGMVMRRGDNVFREELHFVDPGFLTLFHFPALEGDPAALRDQERILLTQSMARKYFGAADPVGQTITINAGKAYQRDLVVGAVLADPPLNSSLMFTALTSLDNLLLDGQPSRGAEWKIFADVTFLKLTKGTDPARVARQLDASVSPQNQARPDWQLKGFALEPLRGMAHTSGELRGNSLRDSLPPAAVWGPNVLALLILLTACLNFTNMTISLADRRLKEMGVRKVLGGTRRQLVGQLLSESLLICLLAVLLGMALASWFIPPYNRMWTYLHLETDYLHNPALLGFIGTILLVTTLVAGAYPAFYISAFRAIHIFQGKVRFGGKNLVTRILLGFQVVISLTAVLAGLAFARNADFQQKADLGYRGEGVMVLPIEGEPDFQTLSDALRRNPRVAGLAGATHHIGSSIRRSEFTYQGTNYESLRMDTGRDYFGVMGLKIGEGRGFHEAGGDADERSVVVNRRFVREMGWSDPVGRQITFDSTTHTVVGIVEDFIWDDFFNDIEPMLITMRPPAQYRYLIVRSADSDLLRFGEELRSVWKGILPLRPYEGFSHREEVLGQMLQVSVNIKDMFLFLAVVSILLSASGLFALVSLTVLRRMREIAIRRVVGATPAHIAALINRGYWWIFLGAIVLGCAGGALFAGKLLDSIYEIHVHPNAWLFIGASLAVLLVVALTMAVKIAQTLRVNPAEVLKGE